MVKRIKAALPGMLAAVKKIETCKHEPDCSKFETWSDSRRACACHKCGVWIWVNEWRSKGFYIP